MRDNRIKKTQLRVKIEVKSGKNYNLTSLRKFREKYREQLHIPYVLHTGDRKEEDGITFLPLYMTPLL